MILQAFDRVQHEKMFEILQNIYLDEKHLRIISN